MIDLADRAFDPHALVSRFVRTAQGAGAIATFIGLVRKDGAQHVEALYLDCFPGFTEQEIDRTIQRTIRKFELIDAMVVHRVGMVSVGEPVVIVATAAEHRRAAFAACDFLMDYLKSEAPLWKKQIGRDGEQWIEPTSQDYEDRARWR